MRLKDFFTVPAGEKVTEKGLYRVLISSICSILLCMACLASTTWAWFAVSIENTGNIIAIAEITPSVEITAGDAEPSAQNENGSYTLAPGEYTIQIGLNQDNPDTQSAPTVYVVMTVRHGESLAYRLFPFTDRAEPQSSQITVGEAEGDVTVSFTVSWVKPEFSELQDGTAPVVIGAIPEAPEEETATPDPEETTEPSETESPTEETTEPAPEETTEETTEPATEETTAPAETE